MPTALETFGFTTGAANVWLLAHQNIWNWPVAIVNNLVYLAVFLTAGLYGDAALQLVYAAFGIYGWLVWWRGSNSGASLPVQRLGGSIATLLAAVTVAALVLYVLLSRFTESTVPKADATTTALALGATWAQSRKYLESWWLWIAADIIYVPLYAAKHLWLTAVLYLVFLAMCIAGLHAWTRHTAQP